MERAFVNRRMPFLCFSCWKFISTQMHMFVSKQNAVKNQESTKISFLVIYFLRAESR